MRFERIIDTLEKAPVIAATTSEGWADALKSDVGILFHLEANVLKIKSEIKAAKEKGKLVFIHIDLAEGVGKDKAGIRYLAYCGADGIISTRAQLIKSAKECGLMTIQRFFVLDSKGMHSISSMMENIRPDMIEIMPGVITKALKLFSKQNIPVIAGGLIETKAEATAALGSGALAVSTGRKELWYL